ncbi:MAG: hypothetical protein J7559_05620, partial [Cohnella sp.]|nr:hypothetical protein [Cohnella sp.]
MKRILITGANSYIGNNFANWLNRYSDKYLVEKITVRDDLWREQDLSQYDVVFHAAAVVHKKEKPGLESLYLRINRDLPIA